MTIGTMAKQLDKAAKYADKVYGIKAMLYDKSNSSVNLTTGANTIDFKTENVVVRPWPIKTRERIEFSQAGLTNIDARWSMRVKYASDILPGDILRVAGFDYEVIPEGVTKDEHNVEWTILTRRRR